MIFDLDGTLIDTAEDIRDALNHALSPYGYSRLSTEETKRLVGDGVPKLIEKIIGKGKREFDEIRERFLSYYTAHIADKSRPYRDVIETLQRLEGYKKAVVTNKKEALSVELLEKTGLYGFFDLVVGADTTAEQKPSPVPVRYVLERLNVRPEQALMIGDGPTDIEAGKRAGVRTVAVGYGFKELTLLEGADYVIRDSIKELIPLLERLGGKAG